MCLQWFLRMVEAQMRSGSTWRGWEMPFSICHPHGCGDSPVPCPPGPSTPLHVGENRAALWLSSFLLFSSLPAVFKAWFHWVELVLIKTS